MGKTTVSSSVFSNVAKVKSRLFSNKSRLSLNKSKFSFERLLQKQKAEKTEGLKSQIQSSIDTRNIAATLVETNRILVEIQQQLALDFANRIAEKKQLLEIGRRSTLKQKAVKKEAFVERGRGDSGKLGALGAQILAPTKSIFDKIIEFLSLVATGIVINNAWKWLQDPENRKKLADVFAFLKTYWKEIIAGVVLVKLTGAALKVLGFLNTIRKIFKRLSGLKRPPKPPSTGGPTKGGGGGGDGCGPVTGKGGCLDQLSATSEVADNLARTLFATGFAVNYFKRFEPAIKQKKEKEKEKEKEIQIPPIEVTQPEPTPLEKIRRKAIPAEVQEYVGPLLKKYYSDLTIFGQTRTQSVQTPMGQLIVEPTSTNLFTGDDTPKFRFISKEEQDYKAQQTQMMLDNPWIKTFFGAQTALDYASMVMAGRPGMGVRPKSPFASLRSANLSKFKFAVKNRLGQLKLRLPGRQADRLAEAAAKEAQSPAFHKDLLEQRAKEGRLMVDENVVLDDALKRAIQRKLSGTSGGDLFVGAPKDFRQQLERIYAGNPAQRVNTQPETQFRSRGGTIFGSGSQSVDSVPAMLAPGEEVIRASAANQFRPFLKDINDNAGRMFVALSNAITTQTKNNRVQEETNNKFTTLIEDFNDQLESLIRKQQKKDYESLYEKYRTGQIMGGARKPTTSQSLKVSATPKTTPKSIQTYRRSSGTGTGNGQPTIVNMPMPAMNLAGDPSPEAPNTNVQESASPLITISSFDSENPYISEALSSYGIFV